MKILTKEEEAAHYRATLTGGTIGCIAGLGVGYAGVALASRRYHFFRSLTLPLKAFLVTSSGTFAGIIAADHSSRSFQTAQNPKDVEYHQMQAKQRAEELARMTFTQRAYEFGRRERYKIVGASWIASMIIAFALVNRNKYLTAPQKLVQARVYAQFLTVGVLVATAAFEISDSHNEEGKLWETKKIIDPNDPEHKRLIEVREQVPQGESGDEMWKDMVAAEEERIKEREEYEERRRRRSGGNGKGGKKEDKNEKSDKKGK